MIKETYKEDIKETKKLVKTIKKEFPYLNIKETTERCKITKWVVAFNV